MLKITGTDLVNHSVETEEGTTRLPSEYFLSVKDNVENEYLLTVTEDTYKTVNELLAVIKENQLSLRASA